MIWFIIIVIIILIFIIYKYFWSTPTYSSVSSVNGRLANLEDNVFRPNGHAQAPNSHICLNADVQQKIAADINKKLQEINACDCKDTCATNKYQ